MSNQVTVNSNQIPVITDTESLKSKFVNSVQIHTINDEICLDMIHLHPKTGILQGRFSLSLAHAKRLQRVLAEHLSAYETVHGEILESSDKLPNIGFQPPVR